MRVVGIISVYNEELVIEACLKHHMAQGIELYLIDNGSTDDTVEIARKYLGYGVAGISTLPREGVFDLRKILRKKRELAGQLNADWFIHLDADEMRLPPTPDQTLAQALKEVDRAGYNAVNFLEFTFIPTLEAPDHEHQQFQETMRWYYPFLPRLINRAGLLHRVNGWKKQPKPITFKGNGYTVEFPGQVIYPIPFRMRHYQFLSLAHAARKYTHRQLTGETERPDISAIGLPASDQLHEAGNDGTLNFTRPRSAHFVNGLVSFELDGKEGGLINRKTLRALLNFVEGVDDRQP